MDLADRLNPSGVTVFVLTSASRARAGRGRSEVPLQDAQRAMRLIRARAEAFGVEPDRLAALNLRRRTPRGQPGDRLRSPSL